MSTASDHAKAPSRKKGRGKKPRNQTQRMGIYGGSIQAIGNSIIPQHRVVTLETQWTGYIAATNVATNFASLLPNSIYQPFNPGTGNTFANSVGGTAFRGVSSGGATTTNSPIGYNYISSNYQGYKVLDYEVIYTLNSQSASDTIAIAMAPLGQQEQPTVGSWTYYDMSAQPYGQSGRSCSGSNTRLNTLRFAGPMHRDLGLTRAQYKQLGMVAMGTQPASNQLAYFGIFCCMLNGGGNAAAAIVDVVLRQRVLITDPVQYGS